MEALIYTLTGAAIIVVVGMMIFGLSVLGDRLGRNIAKLTKAYKDNQ